MSQALTPTTADRTYLQAQMAEAERFCQENHLFALMQKGCVIALSGGADSVFLLHFLKKLSVKNQFPIAAFHVNHGIRGDEGDRDEEFCRMLCEREKIPFFTEKISVPDIVKETGGTIEETARRERYRLFSSFLDTHPDYAYFVTAHTATDNMETVLFRLARGTGLRGLCGIPIQRERYIRPLLSLNGESVRCALQEAGLAFVLDSTNLDLAYKRNYIRHTVTPAFLQIHGGAERAIGRLCRNLSRDEDFLSGEKNRFLEEYLQNSCIPRVQASALHEAIFTRVIDAMYQRAGGSSGASEVHYGDAYALLMAGKTGKVDFPDSLTLHLTQKNIYFKPKAQSQKHLQNAFPVQTLSFGENDIEALKVGITLLHKRDEAYEKELKSKYRTVYQADLSKAYDGGGLYVRGRESGDSYRYGGMTHKVKKLFSDKKLSDTERKRHILVCDGQGILWLPGFAVRETSTDKAIKTKIYAYFFMDGGNNE